MGTYADSKIVRARKVYNCVRCRALIIKRDEYLSFKSGLYSRSTVCLDCAENAGWRSFAGERPINGDPDRRRFDCAAVRERFGDSPSVVRQATEAR